MSSSAHRNRLIERRRLRAAGARLLLLCLVLIGGSFVAMGQTPTPTPLPPGTQPQQTDPCADKGNINNFFVCVKNGYDKVFNKGYKGVHGVFGSVVPGSGIGFGIGFSPQRKTSITVWTRGGSRSTRRRASRSRSIGNWTEICSSRARRIRTQHQQS